MRDPFLLCDPGLLLPPSGESVERHQEFWRRLLDWSADRRLRLGLQGREAVLHYLAIHGWPDYSPPHCPASLKRDALLAVNRMLAAVAQDPPNKAAEVPGIDPTYVKDEDCGMALALDLAEQYDESLLAAASQEDHWEHVSSTVSLNPPPPEEVALAFEPEVEIEAERIKRAADALERKRLTIIGGKRKTAVEGKLVERFSLDARQIVWVEAERGTQPDLYKLSGVRVERDVVICITGRIGHAGSDKVRELTAAGGIEPVLIEKVSEIIAAVQARYGA